MTREKAVVSWSSGKDSAYALHRVRTEGRLEVVALLTTVTEAYARVAMHGVRESILDEQARAAGLPLEKVPIPSPCPNAVYEERFEAALSRWKARGATKVVFGDLFLEDIRAYREKQLARVGLEGVFPLWRRDTAELARAMLREGFRATLVCVDPRKLPAAFAGRAFDEALLADLPAGVDPCGENGEFHTCVHGGPVFSRDIPVSPGESVLREGFAFADLLPAGAARSA
ncbi:MAG: adenine nucleotide alpha hydrolase [Elusimicrobia bacterium]|nr:adenine nucleotide alpha hydrolase [Elusimicrobiota bacterium]